MNIQIRQRNLAMTHVLRTHVVRQLGFALSRFGARIGRVTVRLSGTAHGGVDKRCDINVGLRPKTVRVEDTDADVFAAINHAANRVSRSVARALARERAWEEPPRRS